MRMSSSNTLKRFLWIFVSIFIISEKREQLADCGYTQTAIQKYFYW